MIIVIYLYIFRNLILGNSFVERKIDIEFCGKFLFAKLKSPFDISLKDYLGDFYIVLQNISGIVAEPNFEKNYEGNCNCKC